MVYSSFKAAFFLIWFHHIVLDKPTECNWGGDQERRTDQDMEKIRSSVEVIKEKKVLVAHWVAQKLKYLI